MTTTIPPCSVDLQFAADFDFSRSDVRLFEVDEEIAEAVVAGGVVLKGAPDEEVVLATPSRTYSVRLLETTNVLLMAAVSAWSSKELQPHPPMVQIAHAAQTTLEVVRCAPRVSSLRSLLSLRPYRGRSSEALVSDRSGNNNDVFTFAELVGRVQASEGEIRAALKAIGAVQVDGHWRLVDQPAALEALRLILATMTENGLTLSTAKLSVSSLLEQLPHLDRELLVYVLSSHGTSSSTANDDEVYTLSPSAVVASLGIHILASSNRRQRFVDFMAKWRQETEEYGVSLSVDLLRGRAVSDGSGAEAAVWYWPLEALPVALSDRLAALFAGKARWTADDLRPYVADYLDPGMQLDVFLSRHARPVSSATGTRLYMAKEN